MDRGKKRGKSSRPKSPVKGGGGNTPRFGDQSFVHSHQVHGALLQHPSKLLDSKSTHGRSRIRVRKKSMGSHRPDTAEESVQVAATVEGSAVEAAPVVVEDERDINEQVDEIQKRVLECLNDYQSTSQALAMPIEDEEGNRGEDDGGVDSILANVKFELDTLINYSTRKGFDRRKVLVDIQEALTEVRRKQREERRQRRREKALRREQARLAAKEKFGAEAELKTNYGWAMDGAGGSDGDEEKRNELGIALGSGAAAGLGMDEDDDISDSDQSVTSIEEKAQLGWREAEHAVEESRTELGDIMSTIMAMIKASQENPDFEVDRLRSQLRNAQELLKNVQRLMQDKEDELEVAQNRIRELRDIDRARDEELVRLRDISGNAEAAVKKVKAELKQALVEASSARREAANAQEDVQEAKEEVTASKERIEQLVQQVTKLEKAVAKAEADGDRREAAAKEEGDAALTAAKEESEGKLRDVKEELEAEIDEQRQQREALEEESSMKIQHLEDQIAELKAEKRSSEAELEELRNKMEAQRAAADARERDRQRRAQEAEAAARAKAETEAQISAKAEEGAEAILLRVVDHTYDDVISTMVIEQKKEEEHREALEAARAGGQMMMETPEPDEVAPPPGSPGPVEDVSSSLSMEARSVSDVAPDRSIVAELETAQAALAASQEAVSTYQESLEREEASHRETRRELRAANEVIEELMEGRRLVEDEVEDLRGRIQGAEEEARRAKAVAEQEEELGRMRMEDWRSWAMFKIQTLAEMVKELSPPPKSDACVAATEKEIDEAMLGYEGGIRYKDELTKAKEMMKEMQKRVRALRKESELVQAQNTKLKKEVNDLMALNDALHADREVIAVLHRLESRLGKSPELMTAIAQVRAGVQKQVHQVREAARGAVEQYAAVVKRQAGELSHLKRYLANLVASAEADVEEAAFQDALASRGLQRRARPLVVIGGAGKRPETIAELKHRLKQERLAEEAQARMQAEAGRAAAEAVGMVSLDVEPSEAVGSEGGGQYGQRTRQGEGEGGGAVQERSSMVSQARGISPVLIPRVVSAPTSAVQQEESSDWEMRGGQEMERQGSVKKVKFGGEEGEGRERGEEDDRMEGDDEFDWGREEEGRGEEADGEGGGRRRQMKPKTLADMNLPESVYAEIRYWQSQVRSLATELEALNADTILLEEVGQEPIFHNAVGVLVAEVTALSRRAVGGDHVSFQELLDRVNHLRIRAMHPLARLSSRINRKLSSLRAQHRLPSLASSSPLAFRDAFDDSPVAAAGVVGRSPKAQGGEKAVLVPHPRPSPVGGTGSRPGTGASEATIPLHALEPARTPSELNFNMSQRIMTAPAVPEQGRYIPSYELPDPRLPPLSRSHMRSREPEGSAFGLETGETEMEGRSRPESPVEPPQRIGGGRSPAMKQNNSSAEVFVVHPPTPDELKLPKSRSSGRLRPQERQKEKVRVAGRSSKGSGKTRKDGGGVGGRGSVKSTQDREAGSHAPKSLSPMRNKTQSTALLDELNDLTINMSAPGPSHTAFSPMIGWQTRQRWEEEEANSNLGNTSVPLGLLKAPNPHAKQRFQPQAAGGKGQRVKRPRKQKSKYGVGRSFDGDERERMSPQHSASMPLLTSSPAASSLRY